MDSLKIIIADDNVSSRTLLCHFIHLLPQYKIVGEAASGEDFVQLVLKEKPDIVLVDINMPDLNGMEAVKLCKQLLPTLQVIFITGYDEFAVEAFEISATDYIVKPIERTRLFNALEKARRLIQLSNQTNLSIKAKNKRLGIKSQNSILFLPMEDILFAEKENRKTVVHTSHERYETTETLNEIENKLDDYFFKTHRSYIVNLEKIVKIEPAGETYLAYFIDSNKFAYISKLKINEVQRKILNIHKIK
ncbi:LytR/AlgR family response regulator transcription factor [Thermaerobacillus caldiproteolyticus]|uniref:Two-component system LytT family response regulator n=1 Tax=Thermaerobacillus caldiproteolyticus TaxID=247480 RepID=A0A7V9Z746_9BACL|nr:LytTR family DNA-binding domain-containing protein [Anoxybacillus caldiproteolyticus]MBA2875236.1 two-component system LytT family response regulator [Anoxybacillus caldiproteolyticus]QPA32823.1 response regulator transcription factor [Anoxybacillus caldiproteolyticus]